MTTPEPIEQACEVLNKKLNAFEKINESLVPLYSLHYEQIVTI